jgi:hypothetical protein
MKFFLKKACRRNREQGVTDWYEKQSSGWRDHVASQQESFCFVLGGSGGPMQEERKRNDE